MQTNKFTPSPPVAVGLIFVISIVSGLACHDFASTETELADSGGRSDRDSEPSEEELPNERECFPPILFGHRGTILFRPDNTLPAFQWAIDEGGDGIEIDLRLTKDQHIVAFHDSTTGRTTDDAENRVVSELTLEQIKELDAGAWFDLKYAGTRVPTLGEIVEAFPDPEVLLLLDVKGDGIVPAIVEAIEELGIAERSILSSFDETVLAKLHAALPEVPILYYLNSMDEFERAPETGASYLRIPKNVESDPNHMQTAIEQGYLPAVSGSLVQWNGCLGLVNNMTKTVQRRIDRAATGCSFENISLSLNR